MQGGTGRRRSPRYGGGGKVRAGGVIRYLVGATCIKSGAAKRKRAATKTTAARAGRRQNETGGIR